MIEHHERQYYRFGDRSVEHQWNTRRCIDFVRYGSLIQAEGTFQFSHRWHVPPPHKILPCPHCAHQGQAWHIVPDTPRRLGGWTPEQFLANLPPLFEVENADPSRYYPNQRRAA